MIDGHNDWYCMVEDGDTPVVQVWHRHGFTHPNKVFAFVSWVCNNQGWEILPASGGARKRAAIDVELQLDVRQELSAEELCSITFEIPIESIIVFVDGNIDRSARVVGYQTGQYAEEVKA